MFTITFRFESGEPVVISANAGEKLLDVARKANVAIDAPCSGNGVCGKCRVRLVSGYLDAPINRHITSEEYAAGWRLACLAQISGDAEIEVPDIASAYRSRMKMADLSSPEEIAIFEDLRAQLEAAGVDVQLEDVKGTFHGFDFFTGKEIAKTMAEKRTQVLRQAFASETG